MRPSVMALVASTVLAYDATLGFNAVPQVENRTIDEIYQAALKEAGVVTLWHGGDEVDQQDALKQAFEKRFPGMTLNVTVDLSKYHDGKLDQQLASNNVYVDSIALQTVHDFPRWAQEGALLNYAPLGFEHVYPAFKDSASAAWYGISVFAWSISWNTDKLPNITEVNSYEDFLKPEFKDKLVLTYPNDDDAVLFAFDLIMQRYGVQWFDALVEQNPRWVRGTATPAIVLMQDNSTSAITFTSSPRFNLPSNMNATYPTEGQFVSWPQTAGILKDAPHPEGAKLLHNFLLSREYQDQLGFSIRDDAQPPSWFTYPSIMEVNNTNPTAFARFMQDRVRVERLRFWFEDRLGSAQGLSPLKDDI